MAVVLNSEENSYFSSSSLRRSNSQPKFVTHSYSKGPARSKSTVALGSLIAQNDSASSSEEPSPTLLHADSTAPSFSSTPASSLSLDEPEDDDQILFPSYDSVGYYDQAEDLEPPPSPRTGDSYTVTPTSNTTSTTVSRPDSPEQIEHAEDDSAVRTQPSRHVDYLSHNWKEEDIWSSWKLIVSKRNAYNNSARLENASWRTWIKSKNKLKTVSPETLNWLKDCDVTWLYGPLQPGSSKPFLTSTGSASPNSSSRISKSNSFLQKKPILKKRSMSEIMLQKSISSSSLLKQAAAAVHAQQSITMNRPSIGRARSEFTSIHYPSRRLSHENHPSMLSSISSSGLQSPYPGEKKHIHFNESVEQCIAIDIKGDEEEELEPEPAYDDDSDSDDGGVMMKRSNSRKKLPPLHRPKPNINKESKTIEMLPSTTLKYRGDTPEPPETAMKHSSNNYWNGSKLSPSPSQETLRPSKPSTRMLLAGDEDEDDAEVDWQPPNGFAGRKNSIAVNHDRMNGLHISGSSSDLDQQPSGMRRTPSGMFMPYEEDEDDAVSEGLFGKVVDTVNTAKDIAHVIWNVGWRR
ncbi:hypothetical protein B0O99DRAFT_597575 [Bisporella sp. PMI_857]|nr:hypothetical protein B0O99DRAFT_597575 [Bisporella sp. PMI_857]